MKTTKELLVDWFGEPTSPESASIPAWGLMLVDGVLYLETQVEGWLPLSEYESPSDTCRQVAEMANRHLDRLDYGDHVSVYLDGGARLRSGAGGYLRTSGCVGELLRRASGYWTEPPAPAGRQTQEASVPEGEWRRLQVHIEGGEVVNQVFVEDPYHEHAKRLERIGIEASGDKPFTRIYYIRRDHVERLRRELDRKLVVMSGALDCWDGGES